MDTTRTAPGATTDVATVPADISPARARRSRAWTRYAAVAADTVPVRRRAGRSLRATPLALLLAAVALGACAGDDGATAPQVEAAPAPPIAAPEEEAAADEPRTDGIEDAPDAADEDPAQEDLAPARVARAADHLDVHDAPGSDTVTHTLEPTTEFDSPRALLILDDQDEWLEVLLPVRPNGTTGWIAAADVEVVEVELSLNVDLDARELTVLEAGEEVLTTEVAIGDADHPTPTGTFYITDKLDTGDPNGAYGPYALGLSAWSDVLTEFAGGDGQVGIHGTNAPESIGEAASHGCIRVDNAVVEQLAHLLPLGTPVTVS